MSARQVRCQCGEWSGQRCQWSGPVEETVIVEFMPEQHRASHTAAGNRGEYPHNGARRIRVEHSCAELMVEHDGDWCEKREAPDVSSSLAVMRATEAEGGYLTEFEDDK